MTDLVILGATGQVGQALARVWPASAPRGIWQHRPGVQADILDIFPGETLAWDILKDPAPVLPKTASSMIVLAGVMGADEATLAQNTTLALAAVKAARMAGIARVLVASTQAVYGTDVAQVLEDDPCLPAAPYGRAKLAMEHALAPYPEVTCLRLGNVAGTDALFRAAARQPVTLDRFADGSSPRRSYIGPVTLAAVLLGLCDPALDLPPVLNVASPGVLDMHDVMTAAQVDLTTRAAPAGALACLVPLAPVTARGLIDEARRGGWLPYVAPS